MVNLSWEKKKISTIDIENLKEEFIDKFKLIEEISYHNKNKDPIYFNDDSWKNLLFWADNKQVLAFLLNSFEEKIDLIYIDPPFFTGDDFHIKVSMDGNKFETIAYSDYWNKDLNSYVQMLYERISLFKHLLSNKGLLFIHLDWHAVHYIKLILDEIFGKERFINHIIWHYYNKYSAGKRNLPRAHDDILVYSKTKNYTFNEIRIPREKPRKQLKRKMVDGVLKNVKDKNGHVIYRLVSDKKLDDVWKIPCLQPASKQWTGFPNQKHHKLIERIINLGSNKKDIIADFFCGSGTSLLAAEKLDRRWIGCDISKYAIYLTRKRILEYHKNFLEKGRKFYPFQIKTIPNKEKDEILKSGFFSEDLELKRKK